MKQSTLATNGFDPHRMTTCEAEFLSRMVNLVPWTEFCAVLEPYYPKTGDGHRTDKKCKSRVKLPAPELVLYLECTINVYAVVKL